MEINFGACCIWANLLTIATGCTSMHPRDESSQVRSLASIEIAPITRKTLIIVHAQSRFDEILQAKASSDEIIAEARASNKTIVYLVDTDGSQSTPALPPDWYTDWKSPDVLFVSRGGEHRLPLLNPDVTLVGGFIGTYDLQRGCHTFALRNIVNSYFNLQGQLGPLNIHLPMSATYFWPAEQSLRVKILSGVEPGIWVDELLHILFTRDDGQLELGRAEYKLPKNLAKTIKNPFELPDSGRPKTFEIIKEKKQKKITIANLQLYENDPPVDVSKYRFKIYFNDVFQREFGTGGREIRLLFAK